MLHTYVQMLSALFWLAAMLVILKCVAQSIWTIVRHGESATAEARQQVASGIISALGLSTAIALLATTQLRSWRAIEMFAAVLALRTFVKYAERHIA